MFVAIALMTFVPGAMARTARVAEHYGNIEYTGTDGTGRILTTGRNYGEPVISPDGRTVAFIHIDGPPTKEDIDGTTSLWIGDGPSGKAHRLIGPHSSPDPKDDFASFERPIFSLDGHFIYVSARAWATSDAVHQVSVATGQQRFVIDGTVSAIIRTGPYRGFLLVGCHMYYPQGGSYNPTYAVKPDAKELFPIPGSEMDEGVAPWLKAHGWQAW